MGGGVVEGKGRRGGGLALLYRSALVATVVPGFVSENTSFELLLARVQFRKLNITFAVVYRPPSQSIPHFTEEIIKLLDTLHSHLKVVLYGDFNCPGTEGTAIDGRLEVVMRDYDFIQHVNVPTHVRGNMLDLVFTNEGGVQVSDVCVVDAGVADHFLVMCHLHVKRPTETKTTTHA